MRSVTPQRGDLTQDSVLPPLHRSVMTPADRRLDPAARHGKRLYDGLSASSVGLELGISVILGLLMGYYLDGYLGTTPWLMFVFLGFGLYAGFRGVMRAVRRAERAGNAEDALIAATQESAPRG
jgi:ATP synthase protein I